MWYNWEWLEILLGAKNQLHGENIMKHIEIIAQGFGILGLIFSALSYQEKSNKRFFIKQGLAGLMFSVNFILIGAVSGALFNMANLVRGAVFAKKGKKVWQLVTVLGLYTICFAVALCMMLGNPFQIFLSALTYSTLQLMSVLMWKGNGKHIRYGQFFISSPSWLVHNTFNFSLGGILCEVFMMMSVIISFIRYGKDGFEK